MTHPCPRGDPSSGWEGRPLKVDSEVGQRAEASQSPNPAPLGFFSHHISPLDIPFLFSAAGMRRCLTPPLMDF